MPKSVRNGASVCAQMVRKATLILVLAFASGTLGAQSRPITLVPGHTPGQFSVTPSGAASYHIPIEVPPGIAGLEPSVSLSYSSHGGRGLAGTGWSLNATSEISRCPRTRASDGVFGGVNLDTNDRFCLDGQRLIVVSGAYGAAGSEYRTEMDQFSRITANGGSAADGPESFTVRTKEGRVLQYGSTADSRIEAQGRTVVSEWLLKRTTDINGNSIDYHYSEDNALGFWLLGTISYAKGTRAVYFFYDARDDIGRGYQAGSLSSSFHRLARIETLAGTSIVRNTLLTYTADLGTFGTRLAKVQQCDAANKCLAPLELTWTLPGSASFQTTAVAGPSTHPPPNNVVADFNGDGRADMARYTGTSSNWEICYASAAAVGFTCSIQAVLAAHPSNSETGDFNGDGKADLAAYTGVGRTWVVCLSTGAGFTCPSVYLHRGHNLTNVNGDFNGDGRIDFASRIHPTSTWDVCLSNSVGNTLRYDCKERANVTTLSKSEVGDFDGDGIDDLLSFTAVFTPQSKGRWQLNRGMGDGSFHPAVEVVLHGGNENNNITADFNGDGLADTMASLPGNQWEVCLSKGSFVNAATAFSCSMWSGHMGRLVNNAVGDFNGDGASDIASHVGGGIWNVCLSTGVNFSCSDWAGGHGGGATNNAIGDFNGDGLTDMATWAGGSYWNFSFSQKADQAAILSFKRGANVTNVTYQGMTAPGQTIYLKDSSAVYPQKDVAYTLRIVSASTQSNGVGGVNTTYYSYGGMKVDQASAPGYGRGNLGFRWNSVYEATSRMRSTSEYSQSWPNVGQTLVNTSQYEPASGIAKMLKKTTNIYGCYLTQGSAFPTSGCLVTGTGQIGFVFPIQTTEESWDLSGTTMPTLITVRVFDGTPVAGGAHRHQLGDITAIRVDILHNGALQQRKVTINEYHPAKTTGSDWQTGRLKKATVTSQQF